MRIITEPSVHLVSRQQIDEAGLQDFLEGNDVARWDTDTDVAAEKIVETAGRTCYMSFAKPRPGGNKAYIEHILAVGHGSVLEHSVFGFVIEGISRSLTHEFVRHRAGFGYSQRSQRFVNEGDCGMVIPPLICELATDFPWIYSRWMLAVERAQNAYADLSGMLEEAVKIREWHRAGCPAQPGIDPESYDSRIELAEDQSKEWAKTLSEADRTAFRKPAREAARSVLPEATETKLFVTGNARALRHFLEMRGSVHADAEIRRLAIALLAVLQKEARNIFGDYRVLKAEDGRDYIHTDYHKV